MSLLNLPTPGAAAPNLKISDVLYAVLIITSNGRNVLILITHVGPVEIPAEDVNRIYLEQNGITVHVVGGAFEPVPKSKNKLGH